MNTLLLTALLMSQTAVQPPEPTPAPESEAAPPAESPSSPEVSVPATPPAEPVAPMPGRPARRASSVPLRDQAPVVSTRRLLGVGVAVTGVVLVMVGALATVYAVEGKDEEATADALGSVLAKSFSSR